MQSKQVSTQVVKAPRVGTSITNKSGSHIGIGFLKSAYHLEDTQLNAFKELFEISNKSQYLQMIDIMEKGGKYDEHIELIFECAMYGITLRITRISSESILRSPENINLNDSTTDNAILEFSPNLYEKFEPKLKQAFINLINTYHSEPKLFRGKIVCFATELARILRYIELGQVDEKTIHHLSQLHKKYTQRKMITSNTHETRAITQKKPKSNIVKHHKHPAKIPTDEERATAFEDDSPVIEEIFSPTTSVNNTHNVPVGNLLGSVHNMPEQPLMASNGQAYPCVPLPQVIFASAYDMSAQGQLPTSSNSRAQPSCQRSVDARTAQMQAYQQSNTRSQYPKRAVSTCNVPINQEVNQVPARISRTTQPWEQSNSEFMQNIQSIFNDIEKLKNSKNKQ